MVQYRLTYPAFQLSFPAHADFCTARAKLLSANQKTETWQCGIDSEGLPALVIYRQWWVQRRFSSIADPLWLCHVTPWCGVWPEPLLSHDFRDQRLSAAFGIHPSLCQQMQKGRKGGRAAVVNIWATEPSKRRDSDQTLPNQLVSLELIVRVELLQEPALTQPWPQSLLCTDSTA